MPTPPPPVVPSPLLPPEDSTPFVATGVAVSRVPSDHQSGVSLGTAPPGILPPPQPPPPRTQRLSFPSLPPRPASPREVRPLVSYAVPLDKARRLSNGGNDDLFHAPGSLADPRLLICPASPTTPFEFPFQVAEETYCDFNVSSGLPCVDLMDSVTHVVGLPRVCGLSLDSDLVVRVSRATTSSEVWDNPSLMDGGANICLTGVLDLLLDGWFVYFFFLSLRRIF